MANYFVYTTDGHETLSGICNTQLCSVSEVLRINTQPYDSTKSVSDLLVEIQKTPGSLLPSGLGIRIPYSNSGGLQYINNGSQSTHEDIGRLTSDDASDTTNYHQKLLQQAQSAVAEPRYNYHSVLRSLSSSSVGNDSWKNFNCYMYTLTNGAVKYQRSLPVYPNEFSDTNNSNFNAVSLLGRSVDYQIYNGSSRDVSFVLQMHEELCSNANYIHDLVAVIESACYPEYGNGIVRVPEVCFVIGSHFKCRGILTSTSANWKAPIIDGKLVNCDLSVSIRETTGPYAMSQIASKGAYR